VKELVLAALAGTLLLAGCVTTGDPEEFGRRPEKPIYHALREVDATETQRLAVLDAFDRYSDKLKGLQSRSRQLIDEWRRLDRRDPSFVDVAKGLSERWAAIASERLVLESEFEREVAGTLDASQWGEWQSYMTPRLGDEARDGMMRSLPPAR
jgi:hypothetical protein